jgi:hypothetical protein
MFLNLLKTLSQSDDKIVFNISVAAFTHAFKKSEIYVWSCRIEGKYGIDNAGSIYQTLDISNISNMTVPISLDAKALLN